MCIETNRSKVVVKIAELTQQVERANERFLWPLKTFIGVTISHGATSCHHTSHAHIITLPPEFHVSFNAAKTRFGLHAAQRANVNNSSTYSSFITVNTGDYIEAVCERNTAENISRVLYPNDNVSNKVALWSCFFNRVKLTKFSLRIPLLRTA